MNSELYNNLNCISATCHVWISNTDNYINSSNICKLCRFLLVWSSTVISFFSNAYPYEAGASRKPWATPTFLCHLLKMLPNCLKFVKIFHNFLISSVMFDRVAKWQHEQMLVLFLFFSWNWMSISFMYCICEISFIPIGGAIFKSGVSWIDFAFMLILFLHTWRMVGLTVLLLTDSLTTKSIRRRIGRARERV